MFIQIFKIIRIIFDYLHKCSSALYKEIQLLNEIEKDGGVFNLIGFTLPLFDKRFYNEDNHTVNNFFKYFKKRFEMSAVDDGKNEKIKIVEIEKDKTVKITDGINELYFEV